MQIVRKSRYCQKARPGSIRALHMGAPSNTHPSLQGPKVPGLLRQHRLPRGHACLPHKQDLLGHLRAPGLSSREQDQLSSHLPTVWQQPGHCSCTGVGSADGGSTGGGDCTGPTQCHPVPSTAQSDTCPKAEERSAEPC